MLGTSTASENVSEERKTCVIFTSALFALFFLGKLVAKVQGKRKNRYFPRLLNFTLAFKLPNYCADYSFKSVTAS